MLLHKLTLPLVIISFLLAISAAKVFAASSTPTPLLIRGIQTGEFVHSENSTSYYFVYDHVAKPYFVAIHEIGPETPMYNREVVFQSNHLGMYSEMFSYPDEMLQHFVKHLTPVLNRKLELALISIKHYNGKVLLNQSVSGKERGVYEIEEPLISVSFLKVKGNWEFRRPGGIPYVESEHFVTLQEAMQYRTLFTSDLSAATLKAIQAEKVKERKKLAEMKKQMEAKRVSMLDGIVYKSNAFWDGFTDFHLVKDTFNGDFDGLETVNLFKVNYVDFVQKYYKFCASNLPPESVDRSITHLSVTSDGHGKELYRDKVGKTVIYVAPEFLFKYDEYKHISEEYYRLLKAQSWGVIFSKKDTLKAKKALANVVSEYPNAQMDKFIGEMDCNSASMYQFKDNLLRAAYHKPSVQAAGIKYQNAKNESIDLQEFMKQ